jgi:hypothetical protein
MLLLIKNLKFKKGKLVLKFINLFKSLNIRQILKSVRYLFKMTKKGRFKI